jgi:RimJ/RimL family protein N-acetyltransferase
MYADPVVMRYLGTGQTLGTWASWHACSAMLGHWLLRGYGQWVAEERATGITLGRIGLFNPDGWPGVEVGWALAAEHQGKGYATEGGAAALGYAFDVVGAERVVSLIHPDNVASIRVAEKLGAVVDGSFTVVPGKDALVYAYRSSSTSRR